MDKSVLKNKGEEKGILAWSVGEEELSILST